MSQEKQKTLEDKILDWMKTPLPLTAKQIKAAQAERTQNEHLKWADYESELKQKKGSSSAT